MSLTIPVYNLSGEKVGEHELDPKVFAVTGKPELVHQVVMAEQANARVALAHTKMRGEVRGGGKKPWRQKGTGRARQGSIRSPQWRGGGVVFGPRSTRNYSQRLNKKMKRKALLMSLSDKVASQKLVIFDRIETNGKTKDWNKLKKSLLAISAEKAKKSPSALVVVPVIAESLKRSTKNVPGFEAIRADSLNVHTLLRHHYAITTAEGVKALENWFTKK